jgi:hypothetical protein
MNQQRALSAFVRVAAALVAAAGLMTSHAPVRAAAPAMRQQPAMIVVPNMVAYWPLETATAGQTPDVSPNLNDGTLNAGATISTANHAAIPAGNAASVALAGSGNQMVIVPDSPSLSVTGAFTLSAWIRPTLAAGGNQKGILEKWDWSGTDATAGFLFRLDSANNLSFAVAGATNQTGISTAPRAVTINTWTHVAATCAANGAMTMYVGGNADPTTGTATTGLPTNGSSELHIGADYGGNQFGGNIDEARIYNRELTPAEILILRDGQAAAAGVVATGGAGQIVLTWTPTANATQYSVLRGTTSGTYTTVFNNVTGATFTDTTVTPGTAYFYTVVAISVMAGPNSNVVTATATPAVPPPPPPPPRTTKSPDHGRCGVSSIPAAGLSPGVAGAGILAALYLAATARARRNR